MNPIKPITRSVVSAVLLAGAIGAQAAITSVTTLATFTAATNSPGTDSFSNLTINTNLGLTVVNRSAGPYAYTMGTQTDFFVVPVAGTIALSTGNAADSIVFGGFASSVRAFGGNFFATNILGEVTGGGLTLTATDIGGVSLTRNITGGSAGGFLGFVSDLPLASVFLGMSTSNTNTFASADNVVLAAVPEPGTWLMMLAGGAVMLQTATRRRVG